MGVIVGIDLGTTNSSVAFYDGCEPIIIPNPLGNRFTPSVVRFLENGQAVVGENALRARTVDPKHTLYGVKRFIGRRYNEVFDIGRRMPFKVTLGANNLAAFEVRGQHYTPQFVSALILKALKASVEAFLGETIEEAIITVPAYFGDAQRQATREAGEIAGLNVRRIIDEPTAATLAYRYLSTKDVNVVVLDLGGGTFDVTVMTIAQVDGELQFEVLAVSGDGFLGGDDFDRRIAGWLSEEIQYEYGIGISDDLLARQRVLEVAASAKHELSELYQANIGLPFMANINGRAIHVDTTLTRNTFEELCGELFERLRRPCNTAMKAAGLSTADVDAVLLVGGATRMHRVHEFVREVFGRSPRTLVNPQDAVALGAALQGGKLAGRVVPDMLLLNVTPHALGVESYDGSPRIMIEANTTIPTKARQIFSTSQDNQTSVEVHIVEGDNPHAVDNRSLGRFILDDIPSVPQGVPQIEITMDIDASHVLNVSAKDKGSGKEKALTVKTSTGLPRQDVQRLAETLPFVRSS